MRIPSNQLLAIMKSALGKFTPWVRWSERKELNLSAPGVYLLGRFSKSAPSGKASLSVPLVYVGETCGQSLRGRLYQFERSAFLNQLGHSGGITFAGTFKAKANPSWLYISVLAVSSLEEPQRSAYIRYVERALLWQYVKTHGELPACNRK